MRGSLAFLVGLVAVCWSGAPSPAAVPTSSLVIVANADIRAITGSTLQRIYLGQIAEVDGQAIIPVNLTKGNALRKDFIEQVLARDEESFIAYWMVRRYIGKGSPPREFRSIADQLEYIRSTPGAIGYVDASVDIESRLRTVQVLKTQ